MSLQFLDLENVADSELTVDIIPAKDMQRLTDEDENNIRNDIKKVDFKRSKEGTSNWKFQLLRTGCRGNTSRSIQNRSAPFRWAKLVGMHAHHKNGFLQ